MKDNQDFYPTPNHLIAKMIDKVEDFSRVNTILEPSAGDGAIIDYLRDNYRWSRYEIYAIEKDVRLQKELINKNIPLVDSDFLQYNGLEQYDLILANFPFSDGEKHLAKAIDLMFSGQIVCLLNAETIKNPYTNTRKALVKILNSLGAEIEFIKGAFRDAQRKTDVEVALIHVKKEKSVEEEIFNGLKDDKDEEVKLEQTYDLTTGDDIHVLVKSYQVERDRVSSHIIDFYKNYNWVAEHLSLRLPGEDGHRNSDETLTDLMKSKLNVFSRNLKKKYWRKAFSLKELQSRMTSSKREEIEATIENFCNMEFSEENIKQLISNLIERFPKMIDECIVDLFDKFTQYSLKDTRWGAEFKSNIRYYNAWKTNNAYKVNKKVIMPFYQSSYSFGVSWEQEKFLNDINRVVAFFSAKGAKEDIGRICRDAMNEGQNKNIETEFFKINIYKKGTIHLQFKDLELLRWFNIEASKRKGWLPYEYSEKEYSDLNEQEKQLVENFEGKKSYKFVPSVKKMIGVPELKMIA